MNQRTGKPPLALCLEQTLGNRTHGRNLETAAATTGARARIHRVEYPEGTKAPVPWALRGSAMALRALRRARTRAAVTLFHTQSVSLFAPAAGGSYVVSMDATPLQMDAMGRWYDHHQGPGRVEALKRRLYANVFGRAAAFVAFSEWAAASLVDDYGVDRGRVRVLHPGASDPFFAIERPEAPRRPNILFVGGDFERKGGTRLLKAYDVVADRADLTLVTGADVPLRRGLRVLSGLQPGSPELLRAFAEADLFVLPTFGDCTPLVLGEAMATGLPVITTDTGSNRETVRHGETGFVLPVGDQAEFETALDALVDDGALRTRMGRAAREDAHDRMRASANARRTIALLEDAA